MFRCPKCSASLTEEQFGKGVCPTCCSKPTVVEDEHSQPSQADTIGPTDFVLQEQPDDGFGEGKELPPTLNQTTDTPSGSDDDESQESPPEIDPELTIESLPAPPSAAPAIPEIDPDVTIESLPAPPSAASAVTKMASGSSQPEIPSPPSKKPIAGDAITARPDMQHTIAQEGPPYPSSRGGSGSPPGDHGSTRARFGSSASPMSTLKSKEVEEIHSEGLIIRKRRLRSQGAADIDDADYQVVRQIGKGGMGFVHLAVQTALNRRVAIKELNAKTASDPQNRRKFLAEAAITGELDHPNIVPVHDVGVNSDGRLFYSMKMISGHEWQERLADISQAANIDILMKVADAVSFAHSRNVIHRDLKPENVMLGGFGEVLVTDWGLAVHLGGGRQFTAGGTPCYMAPEMAAHYISAESERNPVAREHFHATLPSESLSLVNDRLAPVDKWSDIYLLGAILFHIATGAPPHIGKTVSECLSKSVVNEIVTRKYDNELIAIALKAMATDPADRYANIDAMQQAIRDHQTHNQSIALATNAQEDLDLALKDGHYEQFQRAMFGFQEAADLWPENSRAAEGAHQAKLAYAHRALGQNDFDLGLQLLDPDVTDESALYQQFEEGARDRDTRARRIKFFRTTAAICALLLIGGGLFFSWTMNRKNSELATTNTELDKQRNAAEENAETARSEEKKAKAARSDAEEQRNEAVLARLDADENRTLAESREMVAQTGRFAATFALAKTYIAANNADRAARQLVTLRDQDNEFNQNGQGEKASPKSLIDWEWHRLDYLCHAHDPRFGVTELQAGNGAVAMTATPDGGRIVVGAADGRVRIYERGESEPAAELPLLGDALRTLHAVAVSPDGDFVAIGGTASGRDAASFQLWNVRPSPPKLVFNAAPLPPHKESRRQAPAVLSIDFSADGRRIVAGCSEGIAVWIREGDGPWKSKAFERGLSGDYKSVRFVPPSPGADDEVICIAGVARYGLKNVRHQRAFVCEMARRVEQNESQKKMWKWEYKSLDLLPGAFNTVDVSPVDPHLVALGAADGSVVLWTWAELADKQEFDRPKNRVTLDLFGHARGVRDVAFSQAHAADGRHTLVTASDDQSLIAWDLSRLVSVERDAAETQRANVKQKTTLWKATRSPRIPPLRGHTGAVIACSYVTRHRDAANDPGQSPVEAVSDAPRLSDELISAAADGRIRRWALDRYCDERVLHHNNKNMACTAADVYATESTIRVATAGTDGRAKVWDAATGRLIAELVVGHDRDAAVVPKPAIVDGEIRIVTCGSDGQMTIWDGTTGKPISAKRLFDRETNGNRLRFGGNGVVPFDISPDGQFVATGEGSDQSHHVAAALWNVTSGQRPNRDLFKAYSKYAKTERFWIPSKTLSFAGSAQTLLISTGQGRVYVWDEKGDQAREIPSPENPARIGVFRTQNGQFDITIDRKHLRIWPPFESENRTPKPMRSVALPDNVRAFSRAATSPEDTFLLLLGKNNEQGMAADSLELWDRQSVLDGKPIAKQDGRFVSAAVSPDGKTVLAVTDAKKLMRWNPHDNQFGPLDGDIRHLEPEEIVYVNDNRFLTATPRRRAQGAGDRGWQGRLWNLAGAEAREEARLTSQSEIRDVRFKADGSEVETLSADGAIRSWSIPTEDSSTAPFRPTPSRQISDLAFETVKTLALSSNGEFAISLNGSGDVMRIWNPQNGEEISRIDLPGKSSDVQIAGGQIAILTDQNDESNANRGAIRMWDVRSGQVVEMAGPPIRAPGRRMALAEDRQGIILAVAHYDPESNNGWVSIWRLTDAGQWSDETQVPVDTSRVSSIAVSPSGSRLVLGERGGDIALWRIDSDQTGNQEAGTEQSGPLLTLRRHAAAVTSIRFSSDGKHLVSTDAVGNAVFWPSSGWNDSKSVPPANLTLGSVHD